MCARPVPVAVAAGSRLAVVVQLGAARRAGRPNPGWHQQPMVGQSMILVQHREGTGSGSEGVTIATTSWSSCTHMRCRSHLVVPKITIQKDLLYCA
jgi:hypothetical protein